MEKVSSTRKRDRKRVLSAMASCGVLLFSILGHVILQSAYAQPSKDQKRLIEESQPSLPSEDRGSLIEELADRGVFLVPIEDMKEILELRERVTAAAPVSIAGNNVYVAWW